MFSHGARTNDTSRGSVGGKSVSYGRKVVTSPDATRGAISLTGLRGVRKPKQREAVGSLENGSKRTTKTAGRMIRCWRADGCTGRSEEELTCSSRILLLWHSVGRRGMLRSYRGSVGEPAAADEALRSLLLTVDGLALPAQGAPGGEVRLEIVAVLEHWNRLEGGRVETGQRGFA